MKCYISFLGGAQAHAPISGFFCLSVCMWSLAYREVWRLVSGKIEDFPDCALPYLREVIFIFRLSSFFVVVFILVLFQSLGCLHFQGHIYFWCCLQTWTFLFCFFQLLFFVNFSQIFSFFCRCVCISIIWHFNHSLRHNDGITDIFQV